MMRTLSKWLNSFETLPLSIECPHMALHGFYDHGPALFEGAGRIEIRERDSFIYYMHADLKRLRVRRLGEV
jgi:hypothetical protein